MKIALLGTYFWLIPVLKYTVMLADLNLIQSCKQVSLMVLQDFLQITPYVATSKICGQYCWTELIKYKINEKKKKKKEMWHFALRSEECEITGLCSNKEHGGRCSSANVSGELK